MGKSDITSFAYTRRMGSSTRFRSSGRMSFSKNKAMCWFSSGKKPFIFCVILFNLFISFQTPKTNIAECQQLACTYFRLNSIQMAVLLSQEKIPKNLVDAAVRMAESVADELTRADGREVSEN